MRAGRRDRVSTYLRRYRWVNPLANLLRSFRISRARGVPRLARIKLAVRIAPITWQTVFRRIGAHSDKQLYVFLDAVLERRDVPGVLVEAGAYKGVSAAKISQLAAILGRDLYVFDSFEGLPANEEPHARSIKGHSVEGWFAGGQFAGTLDEVVRNVERYGEPESVFYVKGWFDDTMPDFDRPVAGAYLDVDLASSTTTCLEQLWPRLSPGGVMVSQDGDFPLVIDAIRAWSVTAEPTPDIAGLGTDKMVQIVKPRQAQ